jgi:lipopolysaccharide biosynthesis glycosyltransferase
VYDLDRNIRQMRPVGDAVFLHFAGAVKPWAQWSGHAAREMFRKYHAQSPWAAMPLDEAPRNTREMRMQSRFLTKRGQVLPALRWYLRYLQARRKRAAK